MKTESLNFRGVATSVETERLAESLGIPLITLDEVNKLDVTIDGADEIDANLNGIKGGGGALLREKIVASATKKNIWVGDSSKKVAMLGKFPLPVEVVPFACSVVLRQLEEKEMNPVVRSVGGENFVTDNGNWIVDLHLDRIEDPWRLEQWLNLLPGVVENGLFLNRTELAVFAHGSDVTLLGRK
jgi:ribose 5-phosphate isomerase A